MAIDKVNAVLIGRVKDREGLWSTSRTSVQSHISWSGRFVPARRGYQVERFDALADMLAVQETDQ